MQEERSKKASDDIVIQEQNAKICHSESEKLWNESKIAHQITLKTKETVEAYKAYKVKLQYR